MLLGIVPKSACSVLSRRACVQVVSFGECLARRRSDAGQIAADPLQDIVTCPLEALSTLRVPARDLISLDNARLLPGGDAANRRRLGHSKVTPSLARWRDPQACRSLLCSLLPAPVTCFRLFGGLAPSGNLAHRRKVTLTRLSPFYQHLHQDVILNSVNRYHSRCLVEFYSSLELPRRRERLIWLDPSPRSSHLRHRASRHLHHQALRRYPGRRQRDRRHRYHVELETTTASNSCD